MISDLKPNNQSHANAAAKPTTNKQMAGYEIFLGKQGSTLTRTKTVICCFALVH